MQKKNINNNNQNNSVNRVFMIIEALAKYPNGCALSVLVKETKLNKSTIYRFLNTLSDLGYVTNGGQAESEYRLTFKIVNIGQVLVNETNIVSLASPYLSKLRNQTGETVNLKFFQKDHGMLLFKLEPILGNFRTRAYMGQSIPLYCSASGKTFLAFQGKSFVEDYWKNNESKIVKITENTITTLPAFLKNLEQIRQDGYAIDHEENEIGISCIAAPLFNIYGEVQHAVSIAMQTAKFDKNGINKYLLPLLEITKKISLELGYTGYEKNNT